MAIKLATPGRFRRGCATPQRQFRSSDRVGRCDSISSSWLPLGIEDEFGELKMGPAPSARCGCVHIYKSAAGGERAGMERESMQYDVVIVGAGPAGLAAAIRLKQLSAEKG